MSRAHQIAHLAARQAQNRLHQQKQKRPAQQAQAMRPLSLPLELLKPYASTAEQSTDGSPSQRKGLHYEDYAVTLLRQHGHRIVARQLRYPYGEIDILSWQAPYLVVVEVRYRAYKQYGGAHHSIGRGKKERLRRAGLSAYQQYQRSTGRRDFFLRFDVILFEAQLVHWIPNAFYFS